MTILQAILLGILQGIAEFLPISSSGHLKVVQTLFHLDEVPLLFDVMLHIATLLAVILVFRKKIWTLLCTAGRFITRKSLDTDRTNLSIILAIILGTIVTGMMGIVIGKILPDLPIQFIFAGFLITAALLWVSSWLSRKNANKTNLDEVKPISVKKGLLVGFAQGIGVFPGISRSGITISTALASGIDRTTAGEFSFLLSIPAILGAFVLEAKDLDKLTSTIEILPLILGCLSAFIAGYFSLVFLMKLIKKGRLEYFAFYLIPLAILGFIFIR